VELEEQKQEEEKMFEPGQDANAEDSGVLKGFLPRNFLLEILDKMREDGENVELIT